MSAALRDRLAWLYREMGRLGLTLASAGNVSARIPTGMLITPSGSRTDDIVPEALVAMDFAGVAQGSARPSSEWEMHARIYQADPAAAVILHAHCDAATALACLGEPLPAFHYMIGEFGGDDVRCAPYRTFGTAALAEAAVTALAGRSACLLANHGMICHAANVASVLTPRQILETLCRQYLLARGAGRPVLLDARQMAAALVRFEDYGQKEGLLF